MYVDVLDCWFKLMANCISGRAVHFFPWGCVGYQLNSEEFFFLVSSCDALFFQDCVASFVSSKAGSEAVTKTFTKIVFSKWSFRVSKFPGTAKLSSSGGVLSSMSPVGFCTSEAFFSRCSQLVWWSWFASRCLELVDLWIRLAVCHQTGASKSSLRAATSPSG